MFNPSLPVVLQLQHEGADVLCVARFYLEGEKVFAKPFSPPISEQPYRPALIAIDERNLAVVDEIGAGRAIYLHRGRLVVP